MSISTYVVHCPMGTLRIAFDEEDGTKQVSGPGAAKDFVEMAMLGRYTPQGHMLTFTTLAQDSLMELASEDIVVLPPIEELERQMRENDTRAKPT